jgi:hypothetical protein
MQGQTRALQHELERRVHLGGRFLRLGREPFQVKGSKRPFLAELLNRTEKALWAAAVNQRVWPRRPKDGFKIEHPLLVLRNDRHPVAVLGKLIEKGHGSALATAICQPPVGDCCVGLGDHGQYRRYPDSAGNEEVARACDQRKVVARSSNTHDRAGREDVVHPLRAAAAVGRAQHTNAPHIGLRRAAAQRILADELIVENEVDVRTWRPRRQLPAIRVSEGKRDDAISNGLRFPHNQVGLVLPHDGLGGRHGPHPVPGRAQQHLFGYER